jgi:hypothetical protein
MAFGYQRPTRIGQESALAGTAALWALQPEEAEAFRQKLHHFVRVVSLHGMGHSVNLKHSQL